MASDECNLERCFVAEILNSTYMEIVLVQFHVTTLLDKVITP